MNELTLSVTQLNNYIKKIFDAEEMLFGICVFGEITNFKASGRATYFDLKDESASLSCVVFDSAVLGNSKNGDKVTIKGSLNYHIKLGRLSFIVSKCQKFGVGDLYTKYLELKEKLQSEGVFDQRYKKQLPEAAKRIGIVSSETGAVIHDIINVTRRKNKQVDLVLFPVKVQGTGAEKEIINGIRFFDNYDVDLIIVARGGGSFEDYAPFNSEEIVRAVFECKKPLVSAIGHESDWTLIDFVADVRAATPSVAAEISVFDSEGFLQSIINLETLLSKNVKNRLTLAKEKIVNFENKNIDNFANKLKLSSKTINQKLGLVSSFANSFISQKSKAIEFVTLSIEKTNPISLLKRGFSKAYVDNKNIKSIANVKPNDEITTCLIDGNITSVVTKIEEKKQ